MPTRVKYTGLQAHQSTWVFTEAWRDFAVCPDHGQVDVWRPGVTTCQRPVATDEAPYSKACGASLAKAGEYVITGQPRVNPGDLVEVEDLNDPKSHRARIVRGHLGGGVCSVVDEPQKKSAAKS